MAPHFSILVKVKALMTLKLTTSSLTVVACWLKTWLLRRKGWMLLQRSKLLYVFFPLYPTTWIKWIPCALWILILTVNDVPCLFENRCVSDHLTKRSQQKTRKTLLTPIPIAWQSMKLNLRSVFDGFVSCNLNFLSSHCSQTLWLIYNFIFAGWLNSLCWKAWICVWCCIRWGSIKWWGKCCLKVHRTDYNSGGSLILHYSHCGAFFWSYCVHFL